MFVGLKCSYSNVAITMVMVLVGVAVVAAVASFQKLGMLSVSRLAGIACFFGRSTDAR